MKVFNYNSLFIVISMRSENWIGIVERIRSTIFSGEIPEWISRVKVFLHVIIISVSRKYNKKYSRYIQYYSEGDQYAIH
jgi:hypothetical protein